MVTNRNRQTPSGNDAPVPANIEVVRVSLTRNREWLGRLEAFNGGDQPR